MIEPCTDRPTVIDLNSVELKYYPFMIGLNVVEIVMSCFQKYMFQKKRDMLKYLI